MHYRCKGELTVFLALTFSILIVFMVTILGGIRRYAAKTDIILAMESSLYSCFGEYNKYLYDTYHLKYIDTSYKGIEASDEILKDHFMTYMQENIKEDGTRITGLIVDSVDILDSRRLSDNNMENLYKQIKRYCESMESTNITERSRPDVVLIEYIKDCFGCALYQGRNCVRTGEIEYVIYGNDSDDLNILNAQNDYEEYLEECMDENYEYCDIDVCMNYEEYLYEQLNDLSYMHLLCGIRNLINENVRANGSPGIDLNECIYSLKVLVNISSIYDFDYSISRDFSSE